MEFTGSRGQRIADLTENIGLTIYKALSGGNNVHNQWNAPIGSMSNDMGTARQWFSSRSRAEETKRFSSLASSSYCAS